MPDSDRRDWLLLLLSRCGIWELTEPTRLPHFSVYITDGPSAADFSVLLTDDISMAGRPR